MHFSETGLMNRIAHWLWRQAAGIRNALKQGLFARALVLPTENIDDFDRLLNDLHTGLRPVVTLESALV